MSTWNYRILRHKHEKADDTVALHEVYYDEDGKAECCTIDPVTRHSDNVAELIEALEIMLSDAKKCRDDVIDYDSI